MRIQNMSSCALPPHSQTPTCLKYSPFFPSWDGFLLEHQESKKRTERPSSINDILKEMMKRAFLNFDKFHVENRGESKPKYQILLKDYLELQKEFVSRKRKLQAAKKKRETVLAEVRFLRQRHKLLSKREDPDINGDLFDMKISDVGGKALDEERFRSSSDIAPQILDQFLAKKSHLQKDERGEENGQVHQEELTFAKNSKNYLNKGLGKRKISWPDHVTLKV